MVFDVRMYYIYYCISRSTTKSSLRNFGKQMISILNSLICNMYVGRYNLLLVYQIPIHEYIYFEIRFIAIYINV